MNSKIELEEAKRIQSEYDCVTESIAKVCNIIKRFSDKAKQLPRIPENTLWCFKHGVVYPHYGWTLCPQIAAEETKICLSAWDGFGETIFDNSNVLIPFDFLNMSEDELVKLLTGNNH